LQIKLSALIPFLSGNGGIEGEKDDIAIHQGPSTGGFKREIEDDILIDLFLVMPKTHL